MFGLDDFDIKKTRFYEEVREEVRQEQTQEVVMRLLTRRIGVVSQELQQQIGKLSIEQLENLAEALLDFATASDLVIWLQNHHP
ncbi:hypothetical protein CLI64_02240 [Nostoc sp. CENA543]|uniref:DUF4351 domain-containing protein n=1 Tax=Nostoc sp. CENA543 TaxID=1869241 RepID=UPI000CA1EE89|nr:DUF4351 domain-containing protein [Nostoc sp. CENA543]AUS99307.1 hypothetical protein CLI64_02240 [Nostoc sp. CENA543]